MYYFKILPTIFFITINLVSTFIDKLEHNTFLDNIYKVNINYDINNFIVVFKGISNILIGILIFYLLLTITKRKFDSYYINFKKKNPNLIETKTNYFLWGQVLNTLVKLHDFSTAILIFISLIQLQFLNKKINLINYLLLTIYALTSSILDWFRDYPTHKQNNKKCMIVRNKQLIYVKSSNIQLGDILYLRRNNSVRVKEAIVIDQDIVAFNLGQTGERTIEEFKVGSKLLDGLIIKNQELVKIRVTKTFSTQLSIEDNINTVNKINNIMTYLGIITILLFGSAIIIFKNKQVLDFSEVILDILGCFIGLNYLIPSFKIAQSLNIWDSVYKYITLTYSDFKVCNHGDINHYYNHNNTVILSDKTGTLTNNVLSIEKIYIDENYIDLILGHINSYLDDDLKHTSHSPETNVIANYLSKTYKIKQKSSYHWIDKEQIIEYVYNNELKNILRVKKITYKDINLGSHSIICKNNKYYHVFMGSKYLLSNRLNYQWKENSLKRGLLIGFIELNDNNIDIALDKFRQNQIDNYEVIGEFHFNNYYRETKNQHTKNGIQKLMNNNYPFYIITGDSVLTAKDIGIELGIIHKENLGEESIIIDGNEFMKKHEDERNKIIENLIEKRVGIFGNTRAIYKEKIVEYFQQYKKVIFLGDQENDYLALKKADLAIVQEKGNSKCKNIANLIGNIPTEIVYSYLTRYRNIGIEGKWWFYINMQIFNYFTAGIWFIGLLEKAFSKTNIIFNDPWEPLDSLMMSISITIYLLYKSFNIRDIVSNKLSITLFTSIINISLSLFIGYIISNFINISSISIGIIISYMLLIGY